MSTVPILILMTALATAAADESTVRIKNLKTLCVVYRGDPAAENHMDDAAVAGAKKGVELGRLFYFRNSAARLNCELHWIVVDEAPPNTDGPTMEHIEADLKRRGVKPGQFDGVFVTGIGLSGNWGGFNILDGTAACFGGHGDRGGLTWYPEDDPGTAYGTAWNFVHEYQHAIDLVIAENSGRKDLLHAHPYADRNERFFKSFYKGGEHWDWIACTFREFDGWLALKGVTNGFLECADADADGMPDDDPRLPMDEKRFGSDPSKKDTDGDGLDDLAEFTAGRYSGSDPTKADTDGDGLSDGRDTYPTVAIAREIPYRIARSDPWEPMIQKPFVRNDKDGGSLTVAAQWNETALYFRFSAKSRFVVHAKIDGSPDRGFWEGGDTYLIRIAADGIKFNGLGLSGPVPGANSSGYVSRREQVFHLEVTIPARLGQGVSKEINYGGRREPDDVADGLTLVAGRSLGLNFAFEFDDGTRALMTPLHTMYEIRLVKPADAPPVVVLRAPKTTSDRAPVVEVLGVRPGDMVRIESDGRTVGTRIGAGPVTLSALEREGPLRIQAVAGAVKSKPATITVDRSAAPPKLRMSGSKLLAECEPLADFELWWGHEGVPVEPLTGGRADKSGSVSLDIGDHLLSAWRVRGYEGSRFQKQVLVDAWVNIDRDFQGGRSDDRLPADAFSYRFDTYLMIDRPGSYTFELTSDDGARLYLDGQLLINHWGHHGMSPRSASVQLDSGPHALHIDYYELDGWAGIKLRYAPPGGELTPKLPIRAVPLSLEELDLFGVQVDRLGNRSGFSRLAK